MAKFDISYVIKAIDRFSPVAKKIAKSANELKKSMCDASEGSKKLSSSVVKGTGQIQSASSALSAGTNKISKSIKSSISEGESFKKTYDFKGMAEGVQDLTNSVNHATGNTKVLTRHMQRLTKDIGSQHHKFEEFADYFATSAYYKFMNVGFPIMGIAVPALKELSVVESASVSLKGMVTNFSQLNEQAQKFSEHSTYAKSEILAADQKLASMKLSGSKIAEVMKGAINYAAAAGISISQAASNIAAAAVGQHAVGTTGVMALGGTASSRAVRDADMLAKRYAGVANAQAKTVTGQLTESLNSLNDSWGKIIQASGGPILSLLKMISSTVEEISKWATENKLLAKSIGIAFAGIAIFLAGGIAIGAAASILSFAFTGVTIAVKGLRIAFIITKAVVWALESSFIILRNVLVLFEGTTVLSTIALKAFRLGMIAVNIVLMANPIGLVIGLIAALALGVYEAIKHWKSFKAAMMTVYNFMSKVFMGSLDAMKLAINAMIHPLEKAYNWFKKLLGIKDKATGKISGMEVTHTATSVSKAAKLVMPKEAPTLDYKAPTLDYKAPSFDVSKMGATPLAASISPESNQSNHDININVHGTNAQVAGTSIKSTGNLKYTNVNLGTNYSGEYHQ